MGIFFKVQRLLQIEKLYKNNRLEEHNWMFQQERNEKRIILTDSQSKKKQKKNYTYHFPYLSQITHQLAELEYHAK